MKAILWLLFFWFAIVGNTSAFWSVSLADTKNLSQACQLQKSLVGSWPDVFVYQSQAQEYMLLAGRFSTKASASSTQQVIRATYAQAKIVDVKDLAVQTCQTPAITASKGNVQATSSVTTMDSLVEVSQPADSTVDRVQQSEIKHSVVAPVIVFKASQAVTQGGLALSTPSGKHDGMSVTWQLNGQLVTTSLREAFNHLVMLANNQSWRDAYLMAQQLKDISPDYLLPLDLALLGWIHLNNQVFQASKRFFELSLLVEERAEVVYGLAMSCLSLNQYNQARQLLKRMPEGTQKTQVQQLLAISLNK